MTKETIKKAEYPLNQRGLGFRSTIESGPYFKDDVDYKQPFEDEYRMGFCGSCAFWEGKGECLALEENVHIMAYCKLYISMQHELDLRHQALMLRLYGDNDRDGATAPRTYKSEDFVDALVDFEEIQIFELTNKKVVKEGDKWCVRSHQTGKSFGCYKSRAKAAARLGQIKGFKKSEDIEEAEIEPINKEDGTTELELICKFAGSDEERKLVYGIVLEPDEVDAHDDTIYQDTIEKAAHGYLMKPMIVGDGHVKKAKAQPVESFIFNPDVLKDVKPGSWVMVVKVHSDRIWEGIKKGDYTGFSIGAYGKRIPIEDPIEEEVEEND